MKKLLPFAMAAALAAPAFGQATSKPVGFERVTLQPGQFNFVGLRLTESIVASGAFDSSTADSLIDNEADFSALDNSISYTVEFDNGAVITASGADLSGTTLSNLSGDLSSLVSSYEVRPVSKLTDIFGETNDLGLTSAASIDDSDVIWLSDGQGGFSRFFYSPEVVTPFGTTPAAWRDTSGNEANPDLLYTTAIIVQRQSSGSPIDLVITGSVVLTQKAVALAGGNFNFVGSIFPAGSTLDNSGLQALVTEDASIDNADVVWMSDGNGGFNRFFYSPEVVTPFGTTPAGWRDTSGNNAGSTALTSALLIQRRAASDISGSLTPPAAYANL